MSDSGSSGSPQPVSEEDKRRAEEYAKIFGRKPDYVG